MGLDILAACRKALQPGMEKNSSRETLLTTESIFAQIATGREVAISYTTSRDVASAGLGTIQYA
jgi:hypothetical protein